MSSSIRSMQLNDYPLFIAPEYLACKGHRNWSSKEATEYLEWVLASLNERVESLTRLLEEPFGAPPSDHLQALGEKAVHLLNDVPFSEMSATGKVLTNSGYALSADMGLLVAKYLFQDLSGVIRWNILRRPKSEMAYNLPVIEGFSFNYLDPIGGSIAESWGVLRGVSGPDAWRNIFEFWRNKGSK